MSAVHLSAQFRAVPGARSAVAELVAGYRQDVTAEPGNRRFDAFTVLDDPDLFVVVEEYEDAAAFDAHLATPHCARFNEEFAPFVVGGRSTLTRLEPVPT